MGPINCSPNPPEASLTMRALERALVIVIITLLNESERSVIKKLLRQVQISKLLLGVTNAINIELILEIGVSAVY